jgi:hypothetical protein
MSLWFYDPVSYSVQYQSGGILNTRLFQETVSVTIDRTFAYIQLFSYFRIGVLLTNQSTKPPVPVQ